MDDYSYHLLEELRAGRISRRELIRRGTTIGLSASTLASILAACGGSGTSASSPSGTSASSPSPSASAAGPPRRGGTLRWGTFSTGGMLEPQVTVDAGPVIASQFAAEYLVTQDSAGNPIPQLATSWTPVKGNTARWRFAIRKNVQFQNGQQLTADDVVASMDYSVNPKGSSGAVSAFSGILSPGGIEKIDDHTVMFHLDRPFVDFPLLVTSHTYNAVILPKNYKMGTFATARAGTGPFIVSSYTPARGATFVRNPNYWDKPLPYLDGAMLQFFPDDSPIFLALEAGNIDMFDAMPYAGAKPVFSNPALKVLSQKATTYRAIHMRVDREPWTDARVRQALAYAIDRRGVIAALFGGRAELGNDDGFAPIYNTTPTTAEVPQRAQDLTNAKRLLASAGHPRGFSATLTSENYQEIPSYLTLVKADAAKIGIDIGLQLETQTTYYGSGNNQPWLDVPFGCVDWDTRPDPGQNIEPAYACGGVWNSAHWCNPEFTRLMHDLDGELDLQRRKAIAVRAARIQQAATPAIIAYWIDLLDGMSTAVQGFNVNAPRYFAKLWLSK